MTDSTVNTAVSFTVPFIASIPAEQLGASGLVAAVVAGLVTSQHGPGCSPAPPLVGPQNWRTVELILEGGVFLVMGLELSAIIDEAEGEHGTAAAVAAGALALILAIRAAYVALLLAGLRRRGRRGVAAQAACHGHAGEAGGGRPGVAGTRSRRARDTEAGVKRLRTRIRRGPPTSTSSSPSRSAGAKAS